MAEMYNMALMNDITTRLLSRLEIIRIQPKTMLIYGDVIDDERRYLKNRYPRATLHIAHHIKSILNDHNASFDLIISPVALQAEAEPIAVLQQFYRLLKNHGLLLFTTWGPDTLLELRDSFYTIQHPVIRDFIDMHHIGDWLHQLRFADPVMDMEKLTLAYDSFSSLFQDLKYYHLITDSAEHWRQLLGDKKWQSMLTYYEKKFNTEHYLPVTLEILYGHAWKLDRALPEDENHPSEFAVSVETIRR